MNVLVNMATLKNGGGQNVGLNFIESLNNITFEEDNFIFVVVKDSQIDSYIRSQTNFMCVYAPVNALKRIVFELWYAKSIIMQYKIDIIYTYFGFGFYPKSIPQVSGSADSNLYFPEIDFWQEYYGIKKLKRILVDRYRKWAIIRSTAIIFENESMEERCKEIFSKNKTRLILPSINTKYNSIHLELPNSIPNNVPKGLFLCGWQRNKNFMKIPEIAKELKNINVKFHFIITADSDNSNDHINFTKKIIEYGVQDMVSIIGKVNKNELKSLYEQIDIVFLLSKLESFSNNIIEAWTFNKPLVVTDDLWSRSICMSAAIFVDRNDANAIANIVKSLISDKKKKEVLFLKGNEMLKKYPTIKERTLQEVNYLKEIYECD